MTLEQTAQEAIEMITAEDLSKWASRHDKVVIDALEAAIRTGQAQAVEPVNWKAHIQTAWDVYSDYLVVQEALDYLEQVFLAATPSPPPAGERAALVQHLRGVYADSEDVMDLHAAEMLEADAREIEGMECDYTDQVMRAIAAEEKLAQQVAVPLGYALAMAVLQSSLYQWLDDVERGECDALVAAGQSPHGDKQ